jgi:hypothetical protein
MISLTVDRQMPSVEAETDIPLPGWAIELFREAKIT